MSYTNTEKNQESKHIGDEIFKEAGYRQSRENDKIDTKYGFCRIADYHEKTGYLINMHSTEILDDNRRLVAALDLFFVEMDGSRFKTTVVYKPYLLLHVEPTYTIEVSNFLKRKYVGQIAFIEHIYKDDLDLPNHLSGIKKQFIKLHFLNQTAMTKVRRDLISAVTHNKERNDKYYNQQRSSDVDKMGTEYMEFILDIREHDVPYHVRVSIDLKIFCGQWYNIRCGVGGMEMPQITSRPDILERPDPVVLAFDIETTKLPLKFPDAQIDQIMMISYMIDGQGYLITNREIISADVNDFEYTPKPGCEGNFIIYNESNEHDLLLKFIENIMEVKPHIFVTYNGDFFDWPFVEARAAVYNIDLKHEIGFFKTRDGSYFCRPAIHMDCYYWVKRDSYLPVGSHGLKAVAKAKLRYDPVELDPEEMCKMAAEKPQVLSSYSVSDAVATYFLYMQYVHPFVFALATIIPMEPDEILRKGSGTLCETLLMVEAYHANIVYPNKQRDESNSFSADGHVLESETYVGGHVEALESGVFRADIPCRFRLDQPMLKKLKDNVNQVLKHAIEIGENISLQQVNNLEAVKAEIEQALQELHDIPNRLEQPVIYHLDVGAMYPNIILTNRLQPSAIVDETDCAACDYNKADALCKRSMDWRWRGEMLPATRNEFQRIQQQLKTEKFPPLYPGGQQRAFHELSKEDQATYEKKRLTDYCRKAYKKSKITKLETRSSTVCQKENSFYVDTVRAFRDRRYEYKGLTKVAKAAVASALSTGDAAEIKVAKGKEVLYDSLQLAHKCILNSFYGYVMRKGARWHSMPMAGIVCLTGSNIITKAREIIEKVGRPLELDTDGIWCILPASFPQEFTIFSDHIKKKKINISYPNAVLNAMVMDTFTNEQYHELEQPAENGKLPLYSIRDENSIFFEVDGPYYAMVLPAAKEEGKKLKKRYAVFNFDGSLAELKGFEVKRRGELQLIKNFQSSVFEAFLLGNTLEECYANVAKVADYWLNVLYSHGSNLPNSELFELVSENRSMSKKLEDYGEQKSTSISTAKRLAEFLGDQIVKDAGLACKYIISKKPEGAPVTERAIPLAIFQCEPSVRRHYLGRWLKDTTIGDADIRDILDWNYYIERLGGAVQKIITIPAALQGLNNPVPRVSHPDWLHKRIMEKSDVFKQRKINEMLPSRRKDLSETNRMIVEKSSIMDIENISVENSTSILHKGRPIVTKRKRASSESDEKENSAKTWKLELGSPPPIGITSEEIKIWIRFQKKIWAWQSKRKEKHNHHHKRARNENISNISLSALSRESSLGSFLRRINRSILQHTWQVIQIVPVDNFGHFYIWAMIGDELHKIKLTVPRIFYVNQRTGATVEEGQNRKRVNRILPRSRPVYYLYKYNVPEKEFKSNCIGLLADLAASDIEGIYETQMSLEFRALIDLGCLCAVRRDDANRLTSMGIKDLDSFSIEQLQHRTLAQQSYLEETSRNVKKIFLYRHSAPTTKKEMWGIFLPFSKKAFLITLDTVRANQMPNLKNLYLSERLAFSKSDNTDNDTNNLPSPDIAFEVLLEVDVKQIYRHIQKILLTYKGEHKGPTIIFIQAPTESSTLNYVIPTLLEFPQVKIHITDDTSLLSGLDWQRQVSQTAIRHFLNLNHVVDLMLDQCRYFRLPLGNMPSDSIIFGADLFFARLLQKNNFVLWWSPNARPDLGGREADDSRLLAEFEDNITVVQNNPGFYSDVCVELLIDNLAIGSMLQANKIREMEGVTTETAFDVIPQQSLDDMLRKTPINIFPSYNENALCSAAFRIMRFMVNGWLREVTLNKSIFSDFQVVHFYRWMRSSNAFLYDPALRRFLNNLMHKMFLQIIAEFNRHGTSVIYADFNRIVINSGKKTVSDSLAYVDYIVQSLKHKEIFHSINFSFEKCWNNLMWFDNGNYSGVKGKLPEEAMGTDSHVCTEEQLGELDMNWGIADQLPQENDCHETFNTLMILFMQSLSQKRSTVEAIKDISYQIYDYIQKICKAKKRQDSNNNALQLISAFTKVFSVDNSLNEHVNNLRSNIFRMIGVGNFSDLVEFKEPSETYVLNEVICKACNHCRDVDLCKDQHRTLNASTPVWFCAQCSTFYDNEDIEMRIIDGVQRKVMSYVLQDLTCKQCKGIKWEDVSEFCNCSSSFEPSFHAADVYTLLNTFTKIASYHNMMLLKEVVEGISKTSTQTYTSQELKI